MAQTKFTFGTEGYSLPTPNWAGAVFELYFYISKALVAWLAATHLVSVATVTEITFFVLLFLDPVLRKLTKMCGLKVIEPETDQKT